MKKTLAAGAVVLSTLFGTAAMADAPESTSRPQPRPDHIVKNAAIDRVVGEVVAEGIAQDVRDGMRRRAIDDAVGEAIVSTVVAQVMGRNGPGS